MVKQKGGILQWILMKKMMGKGKQKGGSAYTPIEEIRRRHFRKLMLKAMKNKRLNNKKTKKRQKGGGTARWTRKKGNELQNWLDSL